CVPSIFWMLRSAESIPRKIPTSSIIANAVTCRKRRTFSHLPQKTAIPGKSGTPGPGIDGRRLKMDLGDGPGQAFRRPVRLLEGVVHPADLNQKASRGKGLVVLSVSLGPALAEHPFGQSRIQFFQFVVHLAGKFFVFLPVVVGGADHKGDRRIGLSVDVAS